MSIDIINPATGEIEHRYEQMTKEQIDTILNTMEKVRQEWVQTAWSHRRELMLNVAKVLRDDKHKWASIITREMGKPITQAMGEIEKCAVLCEYYAENAENLVKDEIVETEATKSFVCYRPLGIIFAIMPWNFPFWQVLRFAVPNLMAGNAGVLSHAAISTGASLAIEEVFLKAGFPEGLFRSLVIENDQSPFVIHHPLVRGVTLTGSGRAGKAVGAEAAKALKKVVLELGGSDPAVILEDADLEYAADQLILSRLSNAGQICVSAKRMIVVESVKDQFEKLILERAKAYVAGDPMDEATLLGPMARADLRAELDEQVQRCIAAGDNCLLGGMIPQGPGSYYPATVLTDIQPDSPALTEELFGPVVCIMSAKDEAEALKIANDTVFGLGACVFTKDIAKGQHIAANVLEAGCCNVNKLVGSDPRLPFGGIKESGYGRELASCGMHEFMNIKSVVIEG